MPGTLRISIPIDIRISTCAGMLLHPVCQLQAQRPTTYSAFASIDGNSFSVVPAADSDTDLYSRTTALKQTNPDLKIFISVG